MTQSIAFATGKNRSEDAFSLKRIGANASIPILNGLHQGDELAIPGIGNFLCHQNGEWNVSWLCDSRTSDIPSAFQLQSELSALQGSNQEPRLISFVRELDKIGFPEAEAWFFSATEWQDSDEVLILSGTTGELVSYLSTVGTTGIWLWSPETMRVQESDRYPFAFRLTQSKSICDDPHLPR